MALEQLIEADILQFIGDGADTGRKEAVVRPEEYQVRRDWEAEIRVQLKRNDIQAAKRIFTEFKNEYEQIDPSHKEERKRTYESLQNCYLAIINAVKDRARTQVLLQRMERASDDVFDVRVRPVDLQTATKTEHAPISEYEPVTKQTVGDAALDSEISMPPPHDADAQTGPVNPSHHEAVPAHAPPVIEPSRSTLAEMPKETEHPQNAQQRNALESLREQFTEIAEKAFTAPKDALALIASARQALAQSDVTAEQRQAITAKLQQVEEAVHTHSALAEFAPRFEERFTLLQQQAQAPTENTYSTLSSLLADAERFEDAHPDTKGQFAQRVKDLKQEYSLVSEDEIVVNLMPSFMKLKAAMVQRDGAAYADALDRIEKYAQTLSGGEQKDLLLAAVAALRRKAGGPREVPA